MPDERTPGPDETEDRRATAQDAAGDLARMGIDPRLLGLDGAAVGEGPDGGGRELDDALMAPTVGEPPPSQPTSGRIVPLRTEYAPQPTSLSAPEGRVSVTLGAPHPPSGPVEELLARTALSKDLPSSSGRLLRAVAFGLVTPDAAEAAGNERELVAALRTRQSERRLVAFAAGKGGVGTTTVLLAVGTALASLRADRTVVMDARSGTASLSRLLGADAAPTGHDVVRGREEVVPVELRSGLRVVDGCGWGTPLRRRDVAALVERLGEDHTFTLMDVGNDPGEAGHTVLARSDQTVIVSGAGALGLAAAQVAAARLREVDPFALDRVVYVIVCLHDEVHRRVHKEVVSQLAQGPARVVVVPPDPVLAGGQLFDPATARPATREAMLEVAAAIAISGGIR